MDWLCYAHKGAYGWTHPTHFSSRTASGVSSFDEAKADYVHNGSYDFVWAEPKDDAVAAGFDGTSVPFAMNRLLALGVIDAQGNVLKSAPHTVSATVDDDDAEGTWIVLNVVKGQPADVPDVYYSTFYDVRKGSARRKFINDYAKQYDILAIVPASMWGLRSFSFENNRAIANAWIDGYGYDKASPFYKGPVTATAVKSGKPPPQVPAEVWNNKPVNADDAWNAVLAACGDRRCDSKPRG